MYEVQGNKNNCNSLEKIKSQYLIVCGFALFTLKNGYVKMKVKQKRNIAKVEKKNG